VEATTGRKSRQNQIGYLKPPPPHLDSTDSNGRFELRDRRATCDLTSKGVWQVDWETASREAHRVLRKL